ncbi:MAG: NADH-ubiquinone oxidoreductase chain B, partial [uncultured Thermomicrobiales bacterium]
GSDRRPLRQEHLRHLARLRLQLGPPLLPLVAPVRLGLLRHRDDLGLDEPVGPGRTVRHALPGLAPAGRPDDHRRHRHQEDGAGGADPLRPDAGAEVGALDGLLRQRRRPLRHLRRRPGGRPGDPGRHLRARLPADPGVALLRNPGAPKQGHQVRDDGPQAGQGRRRDDAPRRARGGDGRRPRL